MEEIRSLSKQADAKHLLFVFDSCFSGSIFLQRSDPYATPMLPPDVNVLFNNPVRQFLTAGDENQEVPGESIFTPLFIRGIKGAADGNDDDYVTGTELYLFLRKEIARYNPNQTPEEEKYSPEPGAVKGDFVFICEETPLPSLALSPPSLQLNQVGLAMGYTRFSKAHDMDYFIAGVGYKRLFRFGKVGLTVMTSMNCEEEFQSADPEIKLGRAVSLSAGYTYPFPLGRGFSFELAAGYERLEVALEINGRSDKLVKNSGLLGGGLEFDFHRFFIETHLSYVLGEDKNLGHDINAVLNAGIKF